MTRFISTLGICAALLYFPSLAIAQESGWYNLIENEGFLMPLSDAELNTLDEGVPKGSLWAGLAVSQDGMFGSVTRYTSGIDAYKEAERQCAERSPRRYACLARAWFHDPKSAKPGKWQMAIKCNRNTDNSLFILGGENISDAEEIIPTRLRKDNWEPAQCRPLVFVTPEGENMTAFPRRPRIAPDEYIMTKDEIIQLQTMLIEWGWSNGSSIILSFYEPSGELDPKTILAIEAAQNAKSWPVTGYLTEQQFREVIAMGMPPDTIWRAFSYANDGTYGVASGLSSGIAAHQEAQQKCQSKTKRFCTGIAWSLGYLVTAVICDDNEKTKVIYRGGWDLPEAKVNLQNRIEEYGWEPSLCKPLVTVNGDGSIDQ